MCNRLWGLHMFVCVCVCIYTYICMLLTHARTHTQYQSKAPSTPSSRPPLFSSFPEQHKWWLIFPFSSFSRSLFTRKNKKQFFFRNPAQRPPRPSPCKNRLRLHNNCHQTQRGALQQGPPLSSLFPPAPHGHSSATPVRSIWQITPSEGSSACDMLGEGIHHAFFHFFLLQIFFP